MTLLKYKFFISLTVIAFFFSGFSLRMSMLSTDDVLLKSRMALLNVKTVSYDCNFVQKFAGGNDTLKTKANICMERKSLDTLLGCNMKMTSQFFFYSILLKTELFYNGKKNVTLNHTRKKATIDTVGSRGRAKPTLNVIKQNFPSGELMTHYSEKLPYEIFFKSTTKINMLKDEKVGSYLCYKLEIKSNEFSDRNKRITIIYIDKQTFLPVRRIDSLDVNKKYQYSDFTLSEIKINDLRAAALQIKEPAIPKDYELDYFRLDRY